MNGHAAVGDSSMAPEILNDEQAQQVITDTVGDLDDVENAIDDVNYTQALNDLDDVIEKLTALRVYINGKIE